MNVKVLISCHKKAKTKKSEVFMPIQLGCDLTDTRLDGMLRDNEGDNISRLNLQYCELTAQYWAWKNLDADYYGFIHYRRYFNLSGIEFKEDEYGNIIENYLTDKSLDKYGINDENVQKLTRYYDVIITERKDVSLMPENYKSIKEQYTRAPRLHGKDLKTIVDIIRERHPEYLRYAMEHLKGKNTSFCNMYILRKDIFFEYCEWMFDVLAEFCKRTDMSDYSVEAMRTPGHLSERLFGIFYLKLISEHPETRVKQLQCVLFNNTDEQQYIEKKEKNCVPVVLAANNAYTPILATCIMSIVENALSDTFYDIVVLHTDITLKNQRKLKRMLDNYPKCGLRFCDVGPIVSEYKLMISDSLTQITQETYYRLLIQELMPEYDKVVYLDSDLVVLTDIIDLYKTDVDGYMLAAARDADVCGQLNGSDLSTKKYFKKYKLKKPFDYFQAGVILFNLKEMRKVRSIKEWMRLASKPFLFNDQDLLNIYCEGKVKLIDMSWNVLYDHWGSRISDTIAYAPVRVYKEYQAAHDNPKIVHFAGVEKPWHNPDAEYAELFWRYARKTSFYEKLFYEHFYDCVARNRAKVTIKSLVKHAVEGKKIEATSKMGALRYELKKGTSAWQKKYRN